MVAVQMLMLWQRFHKLIITGRKIMKHLLHSICERHFCGKNFLDWRPLYEWKTHIQGVHKHGCRQFLFRGGAATFLGRGGGGERNQKISLLTCVKAAEHMFTDRPRVFTREEIC